jgi:subtilase family protein
MATNYLIGRGELLTYPIEAPKKKQSEKLRPYTLAQAKAHVVPQIEAANASIRDLPAQACPDDIAVARMTLHPAYLAKSYFPHALLQQAGLVSLGSRTTRIEPRKQVRATSPKEADTTELFVAGSRKILRSLASFAANLEDGTPAGVQFAQIETFAPMLAVDRLRPRPARGQVTFEAALHIPPGISPQRLRSLFADYAQKHGFLVNASLEFEVGRLLFLPVTGPSAKAGVLADFTLLRVVRPMPKLRAARPLPRGKPLAVSFRPPTAAPLSEEPRVAVLDGGLPDVHPLSTYVRRYFRSDDRAHDVPDYVEHGLGVTSALLCGPIEPDGQAPRPYAAVDHYRVLDRDTDAEDPAECYRTLLHVENVLRSRQYQFINLSLGPEISMQDHDVHAWTAVIDDFLSDGETLMTIAAGNNGDADVALGLNRIQVPADCVNALAIGAADRSGAGWGLAKYSARGPGRSPGRRKPDLVAFGGSPREYFHHATPGSKPQLAANFGTSFSAPLALRSGVAVRAVMGDQIYPLTIRALLVHGAESNAATSPDDIGWGRIAGDINDLLSTGAGQARIIFQGELSPGKFLRAPVPLPKGNLHGKITLRATFCYASPVDPQDASAYTKAGLVATFRPHDGKREAKAQNAKSKTFFPASDYRTEAEQRADLGKWETVLHAENTYHGNSLKNPVFDVHYNAREAGGGAPRAPRIRYALVVTVDAPRHPRLHEDILLAHSVLLALEPVISLPIRIRS